MVLMLSWNSVDHGFLVKSKKIGICCSSVKHASLKSKRKKLVGSESGCVSGRTCLPANCCFSELAL
jgi:hypothetical protein